MSTTFSDPVIVDASLSVVTPPTSVGLSVTGTAATSTTGDGLQPADALSIVGTQGQATTGTTGQTAGAGADLVIAAGQGGSAPSGATNGAGGSITINPGSAGGGAGGSGVTGNVLLATAGGSVGIGTTTPDGRLDVRQASNGSTAIYSKRSVDESPTGNFLDCQNHAGTSALFRIDATGLVTAGAWAATNIGLAFGGTNADLSSTGGTSHVLKQTSTGAVVTVGQLAQSDISGTLDVAHGGTGLTAGTNGGVLGFTAAGTLASSSALAAGALMLGGGAGATPTTDGNWTINAQGILNGATQPRVQVYDSGSFTVPSDGNYHLMTFNSEDFDVGGMHSGVTNTTRLTIPTGGGGLYLVLYNIIWGNESTLGQRAARIYKNGVGTANYALSIIPQNVQTTGFDVTAFASVPIVLVAGDYLELGLYQDSGGNVSVITNTRFAAIKLF